ncbi:MAG: hypothetical protein NC191_09600 [Muribaculaceae bacterium]|nr:hypothetical protein [Muribaculaceae bacterium]
MKKEQVKAICAYWELYDDDDISTECLLEMCRQQFGLEDASDVVEALKIGGLLQEAKEE